MKADLVIALLASVAQAQQQLSVANYLEQLMHDPTYEEMRHHERAYAPVHEQAFYHHEYAAANETVENTQTLAKEARIDAKEYNKDREKDDQKWRQDLKRDAQRDADRAARQEKAFADERKGDEDRRTRSRERDIKAGKFDAQEQQRDYQKYVDEYQKDT